MRCAVTSFLTEGWHLYTTDHGPNAAAALLRRPKSLWVCRPEASPQELVRLLLSLRTQVASDLGLAVKGDLRPEVYFEESRRRLVEHREALRRRSIFSLWWDLRRLQRRPLSEWMGDYERIARTRGHAGTARKAGSDQEEPGKAR
jgi:hypothetical protein